MVMSEDSDWSQCPAVTNSLQREAKERWRGIWVWKCIEWEGRKREKVIRRNQHLPLRPLGCKSRARWCKQEVEKCAWSQGRPRYCDYTHVHHLHADESKSCFRTHQHFHRHAHRVGMLLSHGHKWTEENLLTSTTAKCLAILAKDMLKQVKYVLIWSKLHIVRLQHWVLKGLKGRNTNCHVLLEMSGYVQTWKKGHVPKAVS